MGIWKGKKGSSVFYRIKNSNNAQVQGIRERNYEPSNPQTSNQAGQRMKMLPAQRMAAVLRDIIDRGFEGVAYGVPSRNKFMKYALKQTSGIPATDKDASKVWPGEYLISKGSLPEVAVSFTTTAGKAKFDLALETPGSTVGSLSADLLAKNPQLQAGDQITLCLCESQDNGALEDAIPVWRTVSFFLNAADETTLASLGITVSVESNGMAVASELEYFIAAGLIVSRESSTGGHLRSDCRIKVTSAFAEIFFNNSSMAAARRSYMKNSGAATDWPEEQPALARDTYDGLYELTGLTGDMASCNGTKVKVRLYQDDGSLAAVYVNNLTDNYLLSQNGNLVQYSVEVTPGDPGIISFLEKSDVAAFASVPAFMQGA